MRAGRQSRRVGLARALSKLGFCSRSQATQFIRAGRVRLNGTTPRNPETPVRLGQDRIEVDGNSLKAERSIYVLLNKPRGVVTTAADNRGRDTVYAYLPEGLPWVAPVGRLDKASEGLLLLTNDSEWAARVTAPETHLEKVYHVHIAGGVPPGLLGALTNGIPTQEAGLLRARGAQILRAGTKNTWLVIALEEGRNRQIRRMLEQAGIEVLRLVRVSIGPLALGDLAKGACRALTQSEKQGIDNAMSGPA